MEFKKLVTYLLICLISLSTIITPISIYADDYVREDSKDNNVYYLLKNYRIKKLFSTKIKDVKDPLGWAFNQKTFTVLKEYKDNGKVKVKGYFNAPSIQTFLKNEIIANINDGYTDSTYKPEDTSWLIDVGKDASKENVITKYGFRIPNYRYMGEFPKAYMSMDHIVPSSFIAKVWAGIKALFGASFINAPDVDNYATLDYWNHKYKDESEALTLFIQDYWLDYFVRAVNTEIFKSPKALIDATVTEAEKDRAEQTKSDLQDQYDAIQKKIEENKREKVGREVKKEVTDADLAIVREYEAAVKKIKDYYAFLDKFNSSNADYDTLKYRQCLIVSDEPDKCVSSEHGDEETTLSVAQVYAYSGLYKLTEDYDKSKHKLKRTDAQKVIQKLKAYTGPYFTEVVDHIIICMNKYSEANGGKKLKIKDFVDKRQMPYDRDSLKLRDAANYEVPDPRVELYKSHFIGDTVSNLNVVPSSINLGKLSNQIRLQPVLIDISGRITEISVTLQKFVNFDFLDDLGLSPANMWNNAFVFLIMALLALLCVIKTASAAVKFIFRGEGNIFKVFLIIICLVFELGFLGAIAANPADMWEKTKKPLSSMMNLGEALSIKSDPDLNYFFKGADTHEVSYYLPYLQTWSRYNTGYNINDPQQLIDNNGVKDEDVLEEYIPIKMNGEPINHYFLLLMDSFNYYGFSDSSINSVKDGSRQINGNLINSNAYRVVDHFMAPRMSYEKVNKNTIRLRTKENENYNKKFQNGLIDTLCSVLLCILMCYVSVIKFLTFIWLWYQLYIFIFKVLLDKLISKKNWGTILASTFGPLLGIILIGTWAGLCFYMGTIAEGLIGIIIMLFLIFLTTIGVMYWKNNFPKTFPLTLNWLYVLVDNRRRNYNKLKHRRNVDTINTASDAGIELTEEDLNNSNLYRDKLFDEDGEVRYTDDNKHQLYRDWEKDLEERQKNGEELSEKDLVALRKLKDFRKSNYKSNDTNAKKDETSRDKITQDDAQSKTDKHPKEDKSKDNKSSKHSNHSKEEKQKESKVEKPFSEQTPEAKPKSSKKDNSKTSKYTPDRDDKIR